VCIAVQNTCWLLVELQIFAFAVIVCYCHRYYLAARVLFGWHSTRRVIQGNFINSVTYEEDEMNLAKMKVGTRLGLGFALVLLFLVAVTAVGILRMAQIQNRPGSRD
jgi:hypothetical protein